MIIGCHVQMKAPKFILGAVEEALSYDANAFMLYTGAPQNTRRRDMADLRIPEAKALMEQHHLDPSRMIIHAPYIINLANYLKPEVGELAQTFMQQELYRTAATGATYLVLHPGSFTTGDITISTQTIIDRLNTLEYPQNVVVCLETMAGKGSEIGRTFEEIATLLEGIKAPEHFGVCLDTCHIHDAGYDLADFDAVLEKFEHVIGIDKLHVIHLNDSKNPRESYKDRHENIGLGHIGFEKLHYVASHPKLSHIAKILETPWINQKAPYATEIAMLRNGKYIDNWQHQYE